MGNEKILIQYYFEKLQPLNVESSKPSLHDSPLTWGQKFEAYKCDVIMKKCITPKVIRFRLSSSS